MILNHTKLQPYSRSLREIEMEIEMGLALLALKGVLLMTIFSL